MGLLALLGERGDIFVMSSLNLSSFKEFAKMACWQGVLTVLCLGAFVLLSTCNFVDLQKIQWKESVRVSNLGDCYVKSY